MKLNERTPALGNSEYKEDDACNKATDTRAVLESAAEERGRVVWRVANALMAAFFVMAAGVQFNDPDPYLWSPLYGIAAILTLAITIRPSVNGGKTWRWTYWTHVVFCLGMFVYVLVDLAGAVAHPEADGSLNPLTYEEGREMTGIMITSVWLFICNQSPTLRCTFPSCDRKSFEMGQLRPRTHETQIESELISIPIDD